jgi:FAD/FMN-containing dehydrogenase
VAASHSGLLGRTRATPSDLAAAYPPATLTRLIDVKRTYDPDNRFAHNHNINPRSPRRATKEET